MKILHTADWHLGKYLNNVSLLDDQRFILEQLLDIIREEKPDVMLLAGDIYDRSVPSGEAVSLFDEIIHAIVFDKEVPVIAISGNHDSPERTHLYSGLLQKEGLYITGRIQWPVKPVVLKDEHGPVYFYPVPYTEPELLRHITGNDDIRSHDITQKTIIEHILENHPEGERSVFVGHAFIAGGESSDSERVLSVGGAETVNTNYFEPFSYTALGHLHRPQQFLGGNIQYSGSPLKYSFSEAGHSKQVTMVNIDGFGMVTTQKISLEPRKDLLKVEGIIEEGAFRLTGDIEPQKEDFLEVHLHNEEQVFNAMSIVQKVYPNTLKLRWPERDFDDSDKQFSSENLDELNSLELFEKFYRHFEGRELDEQYESVINEAIKQAQDEENS